MLMDPSAIADKRCCYDAHLFLEPAVHDVLCCVDGRVAKDAVRSRACGHLYGMQCILEYLVNHEVCPKCGVSLDCTMLEPSEAIRSYVMKAVIRCPTGTQNCEWQGPMSEMNAHLHSDQCGVPRVTCPFCKFSFEAQDFDQHKSECLEALVLCPYCEEAIERKVINEHKEQCAEEANARKREMQLQQAAKEKATASSSSTTRTKRGVAGTSTAATTAPRGVVGAGASRRTVTNPRLASSNRRSSVLSVDDDETPVGKKKSSLLSSTARPSPASAVRPASSSVKKTSTLNTSAVLNQSQTIENNSSAQKRPNTSSVVGRPPPGYIPATTNTNINNNINDLSVRSPSRQILADESSFMTANNLSGIVHHQQQRNPNNFPPSTLSPSQLQSWRTMTSMANSSQRERSQNNNNNNSHLLVSYGAPGSSSNNISPSMMHQLDEMTSTMTALVQELSRVGSKCSDLETEVTDLKKSNASKDSQINILTMQLRKVEEQVASLMKERRESIAFTASGNAPVSSSALSGLAMQKQHQQRPTSPAERAMRRSTSKTTRKSDSTNTDDQQVQYKAKNKNYKPSSASSRHRDRGEGVIDEDEQRGDDKYKIPKDVVRDVKRTYDSENLETLMKRETSGGSSSLKRK